MLNDTLNNNNLMYQLLNIVGKRIMMSDDAFTKFVVIEPVVSPVCRVLC